MQKVVDNDKQEAKPDHTRSNLLSRFNDAQLVSGIVFAIGAIFWAGYYFGTFENKREIIQLDRIINSKDDSIRELEEGQNAELKTLRIDNKNLNATYEIVSQENKGLKKENDRLTKENQKLKKSR